MHILMYIGFAVTLLVTWMAISLARNPITRMVKAWSRLSNMVPGEVEAITIGSLEWNDDRNRKPMIKAFRQGLTLYDFEWDHGMIGTWTDPVTATVKFRRGKVFQFFIRFNLVEPQMSFFVKSLPRPFAFGNKELALEMKHLGVVKNVNWPG